MIKGGKINAYFLFFKEKNKSTILFKIFFSSIIFSSKITAAIIQSSS
jgi:hypothetical protein